MMFPIARANGRSLFNEMDRLFGEVRAPDRSPMPVDIRQESDLIVLEAEVPGVNQGELEITAENGTLTISVNRKGDPRDKANGYLVRERRCGSWSRTFRLPETADLDKVAAQLTGGVLTLRVPKKEEARPRQIPIK